MNGAEETPLLPRRRAAKNLPSSSARKTSLPPRRAAENLPTTAATEDLSTSSPRVNLSTTAARRGKPLNPPRRAAENLTTTAPRRGKPHYLRGTPRKTSLPRPRGQTSLTPRRAPNNEMSLEVTQRNYVDDIGHRSSGRANTCHF